MHKDDMIFGMSQETVANKMFKRKQRFKNVAKFISIKFVGVIKNIISPKCENIPKNFASFKLLYKLVVWHLAKIVLMHSVYFLQVRPIDIYAENFIIFLNCIYHKYTFSLNILKSFFRSLDALGRCRVVTSVAIIATYLVFKFGHGHL